MAEAIELQKCSIRCLISKQAISIVTIDVIEYQKLEMLSKFINDNVEEERKVNVISLNYYIADYEKSDDYHKEFIEACFPGKDGKRLFYERLAYNSQMKCIELSLVIEYTLKF